MDVSNFDLVLLSSHSQFNYPRTSLSWQMTLLKSVQRNEREMTWSDDCSQARLSAETQLTPCCTSITNAKKTKEGHCNTQLILFPTFNF